MTRLDIIKLKIRVKIKIYLLRLYIGKLIIYKL